ncbi:MAG TPA: PIN domain-containing protein [Thermoplasmata archaeon]|nr:PIN domain-containing protein [Thermoplasmata archaeon]
MIFVDSSAWIALLDQGDGHHSRAMDFQRVLKGGAHGRLITTDYVLDESITYLRLTAGVEQARSFRQIVQASESVQVVWTTPELFWASWEALISRPDKRWSLTDCLSFKTMENLDIHTAFAFDNDFRQAGFNLLPGPT